MVMRRLTLEGHAPADAAQLAKEAGAEELITVGDLRADADGPDAQDDRRTPDQGGAPLTAPPAVLGDRGRGETPAEAGPPASGSEEDTMRRGHLRALPGGAGAGAVATLRSAPAGPTPGRLSALVDAALAYNRTSCDALLALGPDSDPAAWWTELVEPAWRRVAERTVLATPGEVPEVVLATAALRALRNYTEEFERAIVEAGGPPANHPSRMRKIVLVFAAPDEVVPLSAHALAAALAAQGSMAKIVTGPASTHRSVELVTMVRPAALVLATTQARPDLDVVHAVHESYPELPIFVGLRRDAAASDLPFGPTVQQLRSFNGLLHEVLAVLR